MGIIEYMQVHKYSDHIVDIQISIADDNLHKYMYLYYNFSKKVQINYSNLKKITIEKCL